MVGKVVISVAWQPTFKFQKCVFFEFFEFFIKTKNAFSCKIEQYVFLTKKKIVKLKYPFFIFKKLKKISIFINFLDIRNIFAYRPKMKIKNPIFL